MKRAVFIILTLSLLLLSQAVTLLATRASASYGPVKVERIDFYYKLDEKVRFLDLKTRWQSEHRGELPLEKADELASQAYAQSSMEETFEQWRYQGGPAPRVFAGKAHLHNAGKKALLNVPVTVTLKAKVGALRVNQALQMTDFDYLQSSARWETVSTETVTLPALAPGEDILLPLTEFHLLNFLAKHPNLWPVQLEVKMSAAPMGTMTKRLSLVPDHFVVPILY